MSVSQPYAGAFLNAVPMRKPFRIPTWALRIILQRRLGLALSAAAGTDALDPAGRPLDGLEPGTPNPSIGAVHDTLRINFRPFSQSTALTT